MSLAFVALNVAKLCMYSAMDSKSCSLNSCHSRMMSMNIMLEYTYLNLLLRVCDIPPKKCSEPTASP